MTVEQKKPEDIFIKMSGNPAYLMDLTPEDLRSQTGNISKTSSDIWGSQYNIFKQIPGIWSFLVKVTKRRSLWMGFGSILLLLYIITGYIFKDRSSNWYLEPAPCEISLQQREQMMEMLQLVNDTLSEKLAASYFLCFGTLWGAIRSTHFLPWDNNVDVCVLEHDISHLSYSDIETAFAKVGISTTYSSINGVYTLRLGIADGYITVFREGPDDVNLRIGLVSYVPSIYYNPIYPKWLTEKPLPVKDFLGSQYPVPHGGFEIMMYTYPGNWWRIVPPPTC